MESQTKANFAFGILYFWQKGFPTAPDISAVIEDSTKIITPTIYESIKAERSDFTNDILFCIKSTKASIPPDFSIRAMTEPTRIAKANVFNIQALDKRVVKREKICSSD